MEPNAYQAVVSKISTSVDQSYKVTLDFGEHDSDLIKQLIDIKKGNNGVVYVVFVQPDNELTLD